MRAVLLTGHGGPERLEYREDHQEPSPVEGEVLVRVTASALNNTDIWTREGSYGRPGDPQALSGWRGPISFPRIQGGDIAGVIVAVGKGVPAERVGSRVLVDPAIYLDHRDEAGPREPGQAGTPPGATDPAVRSGPGDPGGRTGPSGQPGSDEPLAGAAGAPTPTRRAAGSGASAPSEEGGLPREPARSGRPETPAEDTELDAPPVGLLGSEADGGFAEYVAVPASHAHDVSQSPLSDAQLASLPVAYGTAMGMLERAELGAGERVLVTGSSGGVGLAAVQLAAARGAEVLALTSRSKGDELREAGAAHVVFRDTEPSELIAQVAELAPGGLDAVADVAGGPWIERLLPLLREEGRWVIAGAIAGAVVPFDLRRLYLHNLRLLGSSMHTRRHFRQLVAVARSGAIQPRVAAQYELADIARAQERFQRGDYTGKITLFP